MKYKAPHWTAAALLVAGIVWLAVSGSSAALALDDVVENFTKARTARFDMTVRPVNQPEQTMKAYYMQPSHFRQELANGYINIADWAAGKMVGLDPQSKQATVFNIINRPDEANRPTTANQFEMTRDLLRKAIEDPSIEIESLGEKVIDGRNLVGFRFDTQMQPMTVWADPDTKFPIRIECTMVGPPETHVVMSNYEFNVDLEESLFDIAVPEGYQVLETDVDASPATEDDLVTALRLGSEWNDGAFPPAFDPVAMATYVASGLAKQGVKDNKQPTSAQMQNAMTLGRGFQFVLTLPKEADAHYAGADVKKDEKKPVFWYKPADSSEYRVIYGDLTINESATAPDVPGAKSLSR